MRTKPRKNFILLCGRSGAGKTTLTQRLERDYGYKSVRSYTTRPRRNALEDGHIFVTDSVFNSIPEVERVAYTMYNGYQYCATKDQVEAADVYVIDPKGIEYFKKHYDGEKNVVTVLLDISASVSMQRMTGRGHDSTEIYARMAEDAEQFGHVNYDYLLYGTDPLADLTFRMHEILRGGEMEW